MNSRAIIQALQRAGWQVLRVIGDHRVFDHPTQFGRVIMAHPVRVVPHGTLRSIERQTGLRLRFIQ